MKYFNIFSENQYIGGLPKKRWLGQCAALRGAWQERRGGVFEGRLMSQ